MSRKQVLSCVKRTVAQEAAFKLQNRSIQFELVQVMQATPDGQMKQVYSILVDEKDYESALTAIQAKDTYKNYTPPKQSVNAYNLHTNNQSSRLYRYLTILMVIGILILLGGLISVFLDTPSPNQQPNQETPDVGADNKPFRVAESPFNLDSIRESIMLENDAIESMKEEIERQILARQDLPHFPEALKRLMSDSTDVIVPRLQEPPATHDEVEMPTTKDHPKIPESETVGIGVKPTEFQDGLNDRHQK